MTPTELASLEALAKAEPEPTLWVPAKAIERLHSAGSHIGTKTAVYRVFKGDYLIPLYAAPANPAAILSLIEENKRVREALAPFANMMPDIIEPKDALQRKLQEWCAAARAALEPKS